LLLGDAQGDYQVVARLVTAANRAANRANRCFVIGGLPGRTHLTDGRLQLKLVNLPGDWTGSTIFAYYVMPHSAALDDARATALVEGDLEWVRAAAAGFLEYGFRGQNSGDSTPLEETIETFAFEPITLPD